MTQTVNYAAMSKGELISIIEKHQQTLQGFYNIIHLENARMSPGEKLLLIAARCILPQEKPNEKGLVRLPYDRAAQFIGMSESSANRYGNALTDRYNATKEHVEYTTLKGQDCILTYVKPDDPLWLEPWNIDLPEEKKRTLNGNGKYCDRCKTNNLKITTHRLTYQEVQECECCGYTKISPVLTDKEELTAGEYIPEQKGSQPEEPFAETATEEKGSEICNSYVPSTPPIADVEKAPQPEDLFSPQEIERQAAQLLLDIAGHGPADEHIEMVADSRKYTTIKRPLRLGDMFAHLCGYKTKGATLQLPDGKTRAICFDADTPEDRQRLQEAAQLLAIVDFKPILEAAPIPEGYSHAGGGKLWIFYDAPVDAYSALQTIYQYTGSRVQHIKEYWPREGNNRVRLPGGKYVHPDFRSWCKLYDASGNELSHDGAGAAAVLLQYQTPAEVVNEYPKPEPAPEPERTKPAPQASGVLGKDVVAQVIADFNASHSWDEIANLAGGFNRHRKFPAIWRGDRTPNVAVDPRTDLAKDFSILAWLPYAMDKYQVWCFIKGGENWQEFKRGDLAQRCAQLREVQELDEAPYPPPDRKTFCCSAGWQWNGSQYVCAQCRGKQERRAS